MHANISVIRLACHERLISPAGHDRCHIESTPFFLISPTLSCSISRAWRSACTPAFTMQARVLLRDVVIEARSILCCRSLMAFCAITHPGFHAARRARFHLPGNASPTSPPSFGDFDRLPSLVSHTTLHYAILYCSYGFLSFYYTYLVTAVSFPLSRLPPRHLPPASLMYFLIKHTTASSYTKISHVRLKNSLFYIIITSRHLFLSYLRYIFADKRLSLMSYNIS